MPTVYHIVHYRKFETKNGIAGKKSLEDICRTSLSAKDASGIALWERAQDRLFDLKDGTSRQILLNKTADLSSAVAGEICLVQTKGLQAFLDLNKSKVQLSDLTLTEIYKLDEKTAPTGSQFVRGMAYWMAIGNHLFFVKIQSLTPDLINSYIDWLIKHGSPSVEKDFEYKLQAEFDNAEVTSNIGDVKSLRVSGVSAPHRVEVIEGDAEEKSVGTSRLVRAGKYTFDQARNVTEAIFGKVRTDSLVDSLGPEEYLSVDASISVRGRRTIKSKDKIKDLVGELDNLTNGKVQVEGKDGRLSDGDAILRTRMPFSVSHDGTNLLEFDNVADQIQEVYSRFVRDKKIVA